MKRFVIAMISLALVFSMTACGNTASTEESGGTSANKTSSGSDVKGSDLTLWIFLNPESKDDPRNIVLKDIVDSYNANNTMGSKVKVESIHYSKFEAQAIQAAAAGTGPDIVNVYTDMLKQHIAGGTIQPMTKYAEEFIPTIEGYTYTADSLKINNEIYTLPWESRTFVFWYRSDIFKDVPKSLGELSSLAGAQSTALAQGFVIGLSDGSNSASFMESFIPFIRSAGGAIFDDSGKAVFNSDEGVQVLNYMKSLIDSKAMDKTTLSLGVDEVVDAFKAGTILSCNAGTQRAATIRGSELNDKIKSAPMLGFKDNEPSPAVVAGQSLGIGKFCKNTDAAFDFIKTFYTKDNQVKWLKANVLPAVKSAYDDAEIKAMSNYEELVSWNEYASKGKVEFYPADYSELSVKLVQAAQNVLFNGKDAKTELDTVANWYNDKNQK
ncbi:carbohydrate ABC transporter substrate-binding protein (CUT1 family) [Ruminiclostridium sufflavum DSM 19573]|uniref:Carbohydrate ABC transporter substrate-binding protein (CUT1 family) n=1 Tax=Ruminiclostridium sufflavum DSM 19573 TaxID=1121337 RepID=A0A318XQ71_9FIRM|nr:extracellular solute-binding protein [Ruminiclostridium sufflavum]PYG87959.1 carbohydrate ABC transporter substrate-binding protein (CUT1 family) [Ruminiclostridium sufflavum DSM 19573]